MQLMQQWWIEVEYEDEATTVKLIIIPTLSDQQIQENIPTS